MGIVVTKKRYVEIPMEETINEKEITYKNGVHPIFSKKKRRDEMYYSSKRDTSAFTGDVV